MKKKILYICRNCGEAYNKWIGKCEGCQEWNKIEATEIDQSKTSNAQNFQKSIETFTIDHSTVEHSHFRTTTGISELDRVLGGGIVPGAAILFAGEPGIGKSTLLLQLAARLCDKNIRSLYISGEESIEQIKIRAIRLELAGKNIQVSAENDASAIISLFERSTYRKETENKNELQSPSVLIIDSIQTLSHPSIQSVPGTVGQVKQCAFELITNSKKHNIALIMVGHITKDGQIAGPKILEHMVDTVIYFEGDHTQQFRIIRATKNRYGPTNEIGVFEMSGAGLQEVQNPSAIFMPRNNMSVSGSCIFAGLEGTRPMLMEIQSLVVPSFLATPRRAVIGWDVNRLSMMIAILNARLGLNILNQEVYLNIVGGLKVTEPAADLAVIVAIISATKNIAIPHNVVFFGEIGLSGELRQVTHYETRLLEAKKLGIDKVVMPYNNKKIDVNMDVIYLKHVSDIKPLLNKLGKKSED